MSCGPVALVNAWKWSCHRASLKTHLFWAREALHWTRGRGTPEANMSRALSAWGFLFEVTRPTVSTLKQHLLSGGAAILLHGRSRAGGHYVFVHRLSFNRVFHVANGERDVWDEAAMANLLRRGRGDTLKQYPTAWFLFPSN